MRLCASNRREKLNFYFQLTFQILQKLTRTLSQRVPLGGGGTAETISTLTQFWNHLSQSDKFTWEFEPRTQFFFGVLFSITRKAGNLPVFEYLKRNSKNDYL